MASNAPFNSKPDRYKRGILYSQKYDVRQMNDSEVDKDLKAALDSYQDFARDV